MTRREGAVLSFVLVVLLLGATLTSQNLLPGGGVMDDNGNPQIASSAFATGTAAGQTQLVASQATGVKIRVLSLICVASGPAVISLQSGGTAITASWPLGANGALAVPFSPLGWATTATATQLNLNQSTATNVSCSTVWMPAQ